MYRVLLVDDELLELEALKNYVDWEEMGIGQVSTARNGKAAWEKILAQEPDIVITDIQMPVMDGIALANRIYDLNRRIKILFLTGYDEVEYLKAAIRVGASDYILKPFGDDSIRLAIEKVKAEIEKERLMQRSMKEGESALIRRICTGAGNEKEQEEWQEKLMQFRKMEQDSDFYGLVQIYGISKGNLGLLVENKLSEIQAAWQDGRKLTVVIKGYVNIADASGRILLLLEQMTDTLYNGAYYVRRIPGRELAVAWKILESCEEHMFYERSGVLKEVKEPDMWSEGSQAELDSGLLDSIHKRLTENIMAGNRQAVEDAAEQLFNSFFSNRISREGVLRCLDKLFYQVERYCMVERKREWIQASIHEVLVKAGCSATMGEVREAVVECLCGMAARSAADCSDTTEYVVRKVKDYIHRNYAGQITAEDLAAQIHLTQNYIRTIFKEGTGKTVLEYLTEYRFEKACELFRETPLKVKEISVRVGYENVPYFCTLFTRIYGMTPNEYRKKYK